MHVCLDVVFVCVTECIHLFVCIPMSAKCSCFPVNVHFTVCFANCSVRSWEIHSLQPGVHGPSGKFKIGTMQLMSNSGNIASQNGTEML